MVKLRLARQGRKKVPIYRIVATDSRSRRDGRFIESLGQYRPSNEPGQKVQIKEDRALYWLGVGAQPTDTVRSLLSGEGILLKWHLEKKKIEPARASEIFTTWKSKRDEKLTANMDAKAAALLSREEAKRKAAAKKAAEAATAEAATAEAAAVAAAEAAAAVVPEATVPEATVPEAAVPEVAVPEVAVPEAAAVAEATVEAAAAEVPAEAAQAVGEPSGTEARPAERVEG